MLHKKALVFKANHQNDHYIPKYFGQMIVYSISVLSNDDFR